MAGLRPLLPALTAAQRDKLTERLHEALGETGHERLAQEIVLAAQKADIDEELSRLSAHFAEVRRVLAQPGAVGKRLDFLMQELHREANTLGVEIGGSGNLARLARTQGADRADARTSAEY